MKRSKKKLTLMGKILIFLIILIIVILTIIAYKNNLFKEDKTNNIIKPAVNYENFITELSETNKELVKEYIAEGISLEKLEKKLNEPENYIIINKQYKKVEYNFEKHLKYKKLEKIYENLSLSNIVKLEVIGTSYDGRNIYSLEIGQGDDKVMLEGNIHAAEIAPTLFLTKFSVDLVNDWEEGNKDIKELLSTYTFVIVPTINPDGYDYSLFGKEIINNKKSYVYKNDSKIEQDYFKANINGVDLNRNMPSQLSGLYLKGYDLYYTVAREKSTARLRYFPGSSVGSEPETEALIYWMLKHYNDAHAYLSLHSAGRVIYNGKPHLSDKFNSNSKKCASILSEYTEYIVLGLESEIDGDGTDGTSTDMIAELAHGYKFSKVTGRLSTKEYNTKATIMTQNMCVLTVETMEEYTQDLDTIKSEWNNRKLKDGIIAITKLNFN